MLPFLAPVAAKVVRAADKLEGKLITSDRKAARRAAIYTSAGIGLAAAVMGGAWYWDKKGRPSGKDIAKGIQDNLRNAGKFCGVCVFGIARWWGGGSTSFSSSFSKHKNKFLC